MSKDFRGADREIYLSMYLLPYTVVNRGENYNPGENLVQQR